LGHALNNVSAGPPQPSKTTERYLGVEQHLHDAPWYRLGLKLA